MSENKQELLKFIKESNWEEFGDDFIRSSLESIIKYVTSKKDNNNSNDNKEENITGAKRVKLVVVGDGAVGKTSLLIRYATGEFPKDYLPTVFENYTAKLERNNETILLHLWDTAGQEDYDRLRPLSYPGADVVLLCFSTINQASYDAIKEKWAPEVHHYIPNIPYILVGTKIDLREEKHPDPNSGKFEPINPDQGKAMANEIGAVKYLEVSSKTGQGVQEVYMEAVNQVLKERELTHSTSNTGNNSDSGKKPKSSKKKNNKEGCIFL